VDQGGQVVGVGWFEVRVIGIEPLHRPLQRAPGIRWWLSGVEAGPCGALLTFCSASWTIS
jgi:hypothetical protein